MSSKFFEAERFEGNSHAPTEEWVVEEGPLQVRVNGKPFTVTMRTPGDDRRLVMGILFSEGLVETPSEILDLQEVPSLDETVVWSAKLAGDVLASGKISNRSLASTSSCGLCGKTEWDTPAGMTALAEKIQAFPQSLLSRCFKIMSEHQDVFGRTGGSHAAAIFSVKGELLAFGEDAGRHNAVDKATGDLWERGKLSEGILLCVSGRVSYEIASKAKRAGFSILAAVSAPSSMAVEYCREADITLIGFCRGERATAYAHPERIVVNETVSEAISETAAESVSS